jgi:hypothetical protein
MINERQGAIEHMALNKGCLGTVNATVPQIHVGRDPAQRQLFRFIPVFVRHQFGIA